MSTQLRRVAAAAAAGDPAARDRLMADSTPAARRMARRLVADPHAVEDVVQESLLEVYRSIGTLREPAAYLGWLGLVVRKHADRHRRRRRLVLDLDLDGGPADPDADPAHLAERGERIEYVRRALRLARDADRRLLGLRYYAEWSDAELAALLGISTGAVRKRLHDARLRLRPALTDIQPTRPREPAMTDVAALYGRILELDSAPPAPRRVALTRPPPGALLPTGIKVLDAVAPWPTGGTVDLLGPVGTGHLVLLGEIVHNLLALGPAALIGVEAVERAADGSRPRLAKLLDREARPEATLIVRAPADRADEAVEYAGRCAGVLASSGARVIMAVDRVLADAVGETVFAGRVGVAGGGSVTGVRVAPHDREAEPVPAWPGADAVTVTSLEEAAAGHYPAIDVLASRSAVLAAADPKQRRVAAECRRVLITATAVRAYLTQNFWMAEPHTGVPAESVTPADAVSGLADRL